MKQVGEWYADYCDETGMWHIFHTDLFDGKAFYSFACENQANKKAEEMNSIQNREQ